MSLREGSATLVWGGGSSTEPAEALSDVPKNRKPKNAHKHTVTKLMITNFEPKFDLRKRTGTWYLSLFCVPPRNRDLKIFRKKPVISQSQSY